MATLGLGARGPEVERLQKELRGHGFDPGSIDGDFGPGTQAALIAFQRSELLLADGIAGPRTLAALGMAGPDDVATVVAGVTVSRVSAMFPATPLGNIRANLPPVLRSLVETKLDDQPMVLMALATIRAETESFMPVAEGRSRFNSSPNGHPFDLYDSRKDLGNQGPPDGESFRGRGYVQLTGRYNYAKYGEAIGLGKQLLQNPELAGDSAVAAKLLASFLKDKERPIKEALLHDDLLAARRLVNGGSHGIDRFTEAFRAGDRSIV